ncbi:MAG: HAMP domain-containing sensor histidine kinase [Armatimonadota bacterium]
MFKKQYEKHWETNPVRFLIFILLLIFTFEALLMLLINFLPNLSVWQKTFLSSFLLTSLLLPLLYFFVLIPIKNLMAQKRTAAQELEKAREEFTTILVHDLKSPLSTIMGLTDLITESIDKEKHPEVLEHMASIEISVDTMFNLINNILTLSKIKSGKLTYTFENFNPEDLIKEIYHTFKPLIKLKEINFNFSCLKDFQIYADREKTIHILYNLLNNAIRYTPSGGTINITCCREKDKVNFEVSDTGTGIPESEKEKIFQKFSDKFEKKGGSGLGLFIVKKYLEGHSSDIRFESTEGKGAKFFFSLPAAKEE